MNYFHGRRARLEVSSVLKALFADIENLHNGRQAAFLVRNKRSPKAGRPEMPRQKGVLFAYASVAVDKFVESGISEDDAAKRVIRKMKLPGPADQLLNHRARLRRREFHDELTEAYFDAKHIVADLSPEESLKRLLKVAGALV